MRKYGTGKILPDEDVQKKVASQEEPEWTEDDDDDLRQENDEADG